MKIVHMGSVYRKQRLDILFKFLKGTEHIVEFYGEGLEWVKELAGEQGVLDNVRFPGRVSHEEALKIERNAGMLLLLKWDSYINTGGWIFAFLSLLTGDMWSFKDWWKNRREKERGVIPQKLFEYLASGRPILSVGGCEDEVSKILREVGNGHTSLCGYLPHSLCYSSKVYSQAQDGV